MAKAGVVAREAESAAALKADVVLVPELLLSTPTTAMPMIAAIPITQPVQPFGASGGTGGGVGAISVHDAEEA